MLRGVAVPVDGLAARADARPDPARPGPRSHRRVAALRSGSVAVLALPARRQRAHRRAPRLLSPWSRSRVLGRPLSARKPTLPSNFRSRCHVTLFGLTALLLAIGVPQVHAQNLTDEWADNGGTVQVSETTLRIREGESAT